MTTVPAATAAPRHPVDEGAASIPLSRVPTGRPRVVTRVDGPDRSELEREGVLPGSVVVVVSRTPLGGPLVVVLGRARLALSTSVAAQVATGPISAPVDPAP